MSIVLSLLQCQQITQARKAQHLTQLELSNQSKVSLRTIQDLETGRRTSFSETTLISLCRTLGLDYNTLLQRKGVETDAERKAEAVSNVLPLTPSEEMHVSPSHPSRLLSILTVFLVISFVFGIFLVIKGPTRNGVSKIKHYPLQSRKDWINPADLDKWPLGGTFAELGNQRGQVINDIIMNRLVSPNETIPVALKWTYNFGIGKPMVYISAYTEWEPDKEIRLFDGVLPGAGKRTERFQITCPAQPGIYRVRIFNAAAFGPVPSFYGGPPPDQQIYPTRAPFVEMTLEVLPK